MNILKLNNAFELFSVTRKSLFNSTIRLLSSGNSNDEDPSDKNYSQRYILKEDLPPIMPNYGYRGDQNVIARYEIKKIKTSFNYGSPPKIRRKPVLGPPVIRLLPITHCKNRIFNRFAVQRQKAGSLDPFIEDLGSIDPMPNKDNLILIGLNFDRIRYYLSRGTPINPTVAHYIGLSGFLPVHPKSYLIAYRNRKKLEQEAKETDKQNQVKDEAKTEVASS